MRDTLAYTSRRMRRDRRHHRRRRQRPCAGASTGSSGPFETWDALGVRGDRGPHEGRGRRARRRGSSEMLAAGARASTATRRHGPRATTTWRAEGLPAGAASRRAFIVLRDLKKDAKKVVFGEPRRVAGGHRRRHRLHRVPLDLQPSMNPIDEQIIEVDAQGRSRSPSGTSAAWSSTTRGRTSAPAPTSLMVLEAAQASSGPPSTQMVTAFQGMTTGLRRARMPVVTAPFGFTFGGGCEITMGGDRVCAAAETYIGLVEVGVGLIPAGGGCLFMLERVLEGIDEPILSNLPVPPAGLREPSPWPRSPPPARRPASSSTCGPYDMSSSTATSSCTPPSGWPSAWPRRATGRRCPSGSPCRAARASRPSRCSSTT